MATLPTPSVAYVRRSNDHCGASACGDCGSGGAPRVLFLDDDPRRAERFLRQVPTAVWVKSVAECLPRLIETWEEIHLDHDLEGQTLVDPKREDSGMEVIRWLCKEPRPHLRQTRFFVHTHNFVAGLLMVLQMHDSGYTAEFRPFGHDLATILDHPEDEEDEDEEIAAAPWRPVPPADGGAGWCGSPSLPGSREKTRFEV